MVYDHIYVAVPPEVTVIQPLPIVVGTSVELICMVSDPTRNIMWTFNDTVIYNGAENSMARVNISREISDSDYGVYTCSASNEIGSNSRSVKVIRAGTYTYNTRLHIVCML